MLIEPLVCHCNISRKHLNGLLTLFVSLHQLLLKALTSPPATTHTACPHGFKYGHRVIQFWLDDRVCVSVCVCVYGLCVCVCEHCVCASQGMMGHRSPVKAAYQSNAVLFLPHFIAQILSFILYFIRHIRDGNRPGYKSYNSLSLLWAYTVSDGERPISEARQDLPNAPSFDEKQRAEDAARDISSRWFPVKKRKRNKHQYSNPNKRRLVCVFDIYIKIFITLQETSCRTRLCHYIKTQSPE